MLAARSRRSSSPGAADEETGATSQASSVSIFGIGSTRDGCWAWPCCGRKPGSGRIRPGGTLQGSSPAEIVGQVARSDALEACHPALQPTVVGVHVLDVKGTVAHPNAGGEVDRLVVQPVPGGNDGVGFGPLR